MSPEVEIRRMTYADITAVREVARTTWSHTYRDSIPQRVQQEFLAHSYSAPALQRRMAQGTLLVAAQAGKIVAFANFFRLSDGGVELAALYVLPDMQGRSVGSQLLQAGLAELADARYVRALVERDNAKARAFYTARGFQLVREHVQRLFGHSFNIVEMKLAL